MTHKLTPEQIEQGWVLHDLKKGEQPVGNGALVHLQFRDCDFTKTVRPASSYYWDSREGAGDIVAYCVVDEKSEPKYTIRQLVDHYNDTDAPSNVIGFLNHLEKHMKKQNDPEYQKYLELKAKFEG